MDQTPARVVIGMDPHKRSVTIEVMHTDESIVGSGRFGTDREGYRDMFTVARQWPQRVWAIEGCNGIGRHIALRLLADGEQVIDVPPRLSARVRPSPPARAVRPTPPTRTPSRWSAPG